MMNIDNQNLNMIIRLAISWILSSAFISQSREFQTSNRIINDEVRILESQLNQKIRLQSEKVNSLVSIQFDKPSYTWTDKVKITIISPKHNLNRERIDMIGNLELNRIKLSSQRHQIDNYVLVESSPDSGVFAGTVTLTGFQYDADGQRASGDKDGFDTHPRTGPLSGGGPRNGYLEVDNDDRILVSFRISEYTTIDRSIKVNWSIGSIQWLGFRFPDNGVGTVRIIDPDMNLHPEKIDRLALNVWSTTDTAGIQIIAIETGLTTGIFEGLVNFTSTEISNGDKLIVTPWDDVVAEYRDHTLPDPFTKDDETSIRAHASISGSLKGPSVLSTEILLDKKTYSWTDKVNITIKSPYHNHNNELIDQIGNFASNRIRIATRGGHELDNYILVETAPDSGVFTGEVFLTGFLYDADGDRITGDENGFDTLPRTKPILNGGPAYGFLQTAREDRISVSFQATDDKIIVNSSSIRWNIGKVLWLEEHYLEHGMGTVQVVDADMNLNPIGIDHFEVHVRSDTDPKGIDIVVDETGKNTGVFEGSVFFSPTAPSYEETLRVSLGDTLSTEYLDSTLPPSFQIGDKLEITATSLIGIPPISQRKAETTHARVVDSLESRLDRVSLGQNVQITADLTNGQEVKQE